MTIMSQDRYEIKEKLGQGGVGAVYHAYDTQLHRDVAIKRVLTEGDNKEQEEVTKNLLKEATALSSVQHPHIVTVYDAGVDKEGPFVVMELIEGRTLDEMVERGRLTWEDLREIAIQSQEGLIAAQDLNLIHRDLKPSNLMLCWLPSGKFQVKIVDFGLAKFTANPSLQTIDHSDSVFGSIYFMAPEQFERTPLDKRTDIYAMGCLYYYALTGEYPFTGETAAEVMASHLQHRVIPLSEARTDIPKWGADWIMWHIERSMDDRPKDSREALERFLLLEKEKKSTQAITMTIPDSNTPETTPNRPKFLFPGADEAAEEPPATEPAQPPQEHTPIVQPQASTAPVDEPEAIPASVPAPEPLTPEISPEPIAVADQISETATETVTPSKPKLIFEGANDTPPVATPEVTAPTTEPEVVVTPPITPSPPVAEPEPEPPAQPTPVAPVTLVKAPAATAPASLTAPAQVTSAAPQAAPPAITAPNAPAAQTQPTTPPSPISIEAKKGMPAAAKWSIIGTLALVVALTVAVMFIKGGERKEAKSYNALMERAVKLEDEGKLDDGLEISKEELTALLKRASSMEDNKKRVILRKCLAFAKGDGFDADPIMIDHITGALMPESLRSDLLQYVIARRKNPSNIDPLLKYAKTTAETESATQAIKAAQASAKGVSADTYFGEFLDLINNTEADSIRSAAENAASELIASSSNKEKFSSSIRGSYEAAVEDSAKFALLRLLGTTGGQQASKVVNEALKSGNEATKSAAIASLGRWADDSQFETLTTFIFDTDNDQLRKKAFDSAYSFLRLDRKRKSAQLGELWRLLADVAQTQREKLQIIRGLANQKHPWALPMLVSYTKDKDDVIIDKAERAKTHLSRIIREQKNKRKRK